MISRAAALALVAVGVGCGPERGEPPSGGEPPPRPPGPLVAATIGWAEVPQAPPPEVARLAEQGRATRDPEAAAALLARAVAAAPGLDDLRWDLGVALAEAGRFDEATEQLAVALGRDLPSFASRLDAEPRLAALRASAHGPRLAALREALRARWSDAAATGVPATAGREPPTRDHPPPILRAGVYHEPSARFVPMGPRVRDARHTLFDPEHRVVVTHARAVLRSGETPPHRLVAHPALGGAPLAEVRIDAAHHLAFHALPEGVRYRVSSSPQAGLAGAPWREVTRAEPRPHTASSSSPPDRHFVEAGHLRGPGYAHDGARTLLGDLTITLEGGVARLHLPDGRRVDLGADHARPDLTRAAVASADGAVWFVVGHDRTAHVIDRVDVERGAAEEWARGHGLAVARRGPDGSLYFQRRDATFRLADPRASVTALRPLPDGVRLAPGLY